MNTKKCVECDQFRSTDDFRKDSRTKDGIAKTCLYCQAEAVGLSKEDYEWELIVGHRSLQKGEVVNSNRREQQILVWKNKNRDRLREYGRKYYKQNPQIIREALNRRKARKSNTTGHPFTESDRLELIEEYEGRCAYCGTKPDTLEMDHIVPLCQGGPHTKRNVVPACFACNRRKGKKTPEQAGMIFVIQLGHVLE